MSGVVLELNLTPDEQRAAVQAADRLLREPLLTAMLDRMQENATLVALNGATADVREDARQYYLAIDRFRASLTATLQHFQPPPGAREA